MYRIGSGLLLLVLAACSSEPEPGPPTAEGTPAQSPVLSETELSGAAGSQIVPAELANSGEISSQYQKFDLGNCTETNRATEGASITWRCTGPNRIQFWVHDGDGRQDVDIGVQNNDFTTIGAFNSIGDTLEWRMRDGRPYALIFRYLDATIEKRGRTVLAVEKIAASGQAGCRVAQIAGSIPDANLRARQIADDVAPSFECGKQGIRYLGDAR